MHQQYQIAKGWRFVARILKAAVRPTARRLRVVVTLALIFASAGRLAPAQADAAGDVAVGYYMLAQQVGGARTICVGDKVDIRVSVSQRVTYEEGYTVVPVIGVQIGASVDGGGVGTISPKEVMSNLDSEGAALFTFSALKPGTATVVFQGKVDQRRLLGLAFGGNTVTTNKTLKVADCDYKVTTISRFSAQGVNLVATMDGGMKRDADGRFTGLTTVNWTGGVTASGDCSGVIDIASSKAELTGEQDGDRLIVDVTYLPAALTHSFSCKGTRSTSQALVIPNPLTLSVPEDGGQLRSFQDLYEPKFYSMHGSVIFIVTRVTGK